MRRQIIYPIVVLTTTVFFLKLYWAYTTAGSPDLPLWERFLATIREYGGIETYYRGGLYVEPAGSYINPFNHPPFIIHYLRFVGFVADATGIPLRFWFRAITSVADLGSVLFVYRLAIAAGMNPRAVILYTVAPATTIISGYHGNTDTLMIFFVLLSCYLAETGRPIWLAGLVFGMAFNIKIAAIIFAPAFFFYLPSIKRRLWFFVPALTIFLAASLPYIALDPAIIIREVFGYRSVAGRWGWTRILGVRRGTLTSVSGYALLAGIFLVSWAVNKREERKPLFTQLGAASFLFMALTPGWGANYMAWLDPWVIALGLGGTLLYYTYCGALMIYLYFVQHNEATVLMDACWVTVLAIAYIYLRTLIKRTA